MTAAIRSSASTVLVHSLTPQVCCIGINRPAVRNAVDRSTAAALRDVMLQFNECPTTHTAILYGVGAHFCSGADLTAIAGGDPNVTTALGPMGPTALTLNKPVIAALDGFTVAGGLELAVWCDIRVATRRTTLGVFCRRFGVPLIDGGTVRLPRLIGHSRAMDLILTGRAVGASEAHGMGLVNYIAEEKEDEAEIPRDCGLSSYSVRECKSNQEEEDCKLPGWVAEEQVCPALFREAARVAKQIASMPQICMRNDRMSSIEQWSLPLGTALERELFVHGKNTMDSTSLKDQAEVFAASRKKVKGGS